MDNYLKLAEYKLLQLKGKRLRVDRKIRRAVRGLPLLNCRQKIYFYNLVLKTYKRYKQGVLQALDEEYLFARKYFSENKSLNQSFQELVNDAFNASQNLIEQIAEVETMLESAPETIIKDAAQEICSEVSDLKLDSECDPVALTKVLQLTKDFLNSPEFIFNKANALINACDVTLQFKQNKYLAACCYILIGLLIIAAAALGNFATGGFSTPISIIGFTVGVKIIINGLTLLFNTMSGVGLSRLRKGVKHVRKKTLVELCDKLIRYLTRKGGFRNSRLVSASSTDSLSSQGSPSTASIRPVSAFFQVQKRPKKRSKQSLTHSRNA